MKQTEIKIINHGEPSIESLSDSEQKIFYVTLLAKMLELHKQKKLQTESLMKNSKE